jgi:ADP-heptose:LPS heptosyltransferase
MQAQRDVPRRLLIHPGAIGDCIAALPAMERLRAGYTEVWVASQNVPLIRFADRVRSIPSTGLNLLEIPDRDPPAGLVEDLRSFDSIVSWYGANRDQFRAVVEGLGLPVRLLPALPAAAGVHVVDFYLGQIGAETGAAPRIECPRGDGGFAVIHPFSSRPAKNWPLERFRELAQLLGRRMPVEWCAGPGELLDQARRFDDLYELACWLAQARVYIGNDSGIAHLAAATGAPMVVLFGPTDPAVWAPRGRNVRVICRPGSVDRVSLDEVAHAVEGALASVELW